MPDQDFEIFITKAIDSLPKEFADKLENVSVVMADWPNTHQQKSLKRKDRGGLLLGLYEGVPQTRRGRYGIGPTLPDKITIFKLPILMISKSHKEVVTTIKNTVLHEIAHHFGMSEEAIHKAKSNN